ncbi:MAG: hypothetical protein OEQ39_24315, partial [Gammaproteobacteria bacterium]|nr:hypothetical protein [Gammaproteobacteria bacterium]
MRDKDVALQIADENGLTYTLVSAASKGLIGNAMEFAANIFRCAFFTFKYDIDIWVTKYGSANIAAKIFGRKSIAFNDDDADVVPLIASTSYPFADSVLVPDVTRMGRFENKARRYPGSHELFYLHPNRFSPNPDIYELLGIPEDQRFCLIRLSALTAHHDIGIKGIGNEFVREIVKVCGEDVRVFISSEAPIDKEFEVFRLCIPVSRIFDALYYAEFLVADSQTMTSEAGTIGTASFRISDFVGKISYIAELEKYGLSFGYKPGESENALSQIKVAVAAPDYKQASRERLEDFLDVK